jgi:hypothetical protein
MNRFPTRDISLIKPAPENEAVYSAIAWDDPAIKELANSIKEHGLNEPILISKDGYIISGHRRRSGWIDASPCQGPSDLARRRSRRVHSTAGRNEYPEDKKHE